MNQEDNIGNFIPSRCFFLNQISQRTLVNFYFDRETELLF